MKSIAKRISIFLMAATLLLCSFIPVSADDVYQMGIAEPTVANNAGYVNLLLEHDTTGARVVLCLPFSYVRYNTAMELPNEPFITVSIYSDSVVFTTKTYSDDAYGYFSLFRHLSSNPNYCYRVVSEYFSGSSLQYTFNITDTYPNYSVVGAYARGGNIGYYFSQTNRQFDVLWNDEAIFYNQFLEALSSLDDIYATLSEDIYVALTDIIYEMTVSNQLSQTQIDNLALLLAELVESNELNADILAELITNNNWNKYIESWLSANHSRLVDIDYNTDEIERILAQIRDELRLEGESTHEDLDTDSNDSYNSKEDDLVNKDTSDAQADLNIDIDANGSAVIWDIVDRLINSNSKIMGLFISVLTIGIIALILNR